MKKMNATSSQSHDVRYGFGEPPIELISTAKHHLRNLSLMIQTAVLWVTFLYIPVYGVLLYLKTFTFISVGSLCYLLSFVLTFLVLVMINRERHTFNN